MGILSIVSYLLRQLLNAFLFLGFILDMALSLFVTVIHHILDLLRTGIKPD